MKRILIVDDDRGLQEAFRYIFSPAIYEVAIFATAAEILNGHYRIPDLFIIDKQLSGVDGLDLCRFLKKGENTSAIPVIMISATPRLQVLARSAGADAMIEKPFSVGVLRGLVEKLLQNP